MQLSGKTILELCKGNKPLIEDMQPSTRVLNGSQVISFGLGPAGYDVRLSEEFKYILDVVSDDDSHNRMVIMDPHVYDDKPYQVGTIPEQGLVLNPGEFILGRAMERVNLPEDVVGKCLTKSSYARLGIYVLTTTLQPGFSGDVVLEIVNLGNVPVRIYANVGIAQFEFHKLDQPATPYNGNYQNQVGVQPTNLVQETKLPSGTRPITAEERKHIQMQVNEIHAIGPMANEADLRKLKVFNDILLSGVVPIYID